MSKNTLVCARFCFLLAFISIVFLSKAAAGVATEQDLNFKNSSQPVTNPTVHLTIAYGERLDWEGNFSNDVNWIVRKEGNIVQQGTGATLLNFVFTQPGEYVVELSDIHLGNSNSCEHHDFVEEIQVSVLSKRMVFDFGNVTFSSPVNSGGVAGIVLSVPVTVATFDGSSFLFEPQDVVTAGVGSNIVATPVQTAMTLSPGVHVLQYTLSGGVDRPTFVMFDFVDVNGKVQSFGLSQQIH